MASYNKVILAGNLTRDPQLSFLPSNTPVVEFGLAVNHKWRSKEGEQRESVCYVDCRLYGKGAEIFNQYMSKGRGVLVDGRLDFQQWETPDGQKRSKHMVRVETFQFLGGRGEGGDGGGGGGGYASSPPAARAPAPPPPVDSGPVPSQAPPPAPVDSGPPPPSDDGIPF